MYVTSKCYFAIHHIVFYTVFLFKFTKNTVFGKLHVHS